MKKARYAELGSMLSGAIGTKTQQEVADWCGVSQPAVNSWLMGYTLPRKSFLAILAKCLNIDPRELAIVAGYDPEELLTLYESSFAGEEGFNDFLESQSQKVEWIHDLWIRGDPEQARNWAETLDHNLKAKLLQYTSSKYQKPILRLRSANLLELGCSYSVGLLTNTAYVSFGQIIQQQEEIAEKLSEDEPLFRASINRGDAFYGQKRYYEARFHYAVAAEGIKDWYWQPEALRASGLCSAYLVNAGHEKYKAEFQKAETQIQIMLDRGKFPDPATASTTFEFMARGQALLNHPRQALNMLEKGGETLAEARKQGEKAVHREIQLMRAEIITLMQLKEDKNAIGKLAEKGLWLANYHGYGRYAEDFEDFRQKLGM